MENQSRPRDRRSSVRLGATCPCAHTRFDDEGEPFDQRPSKSVNLSVEGVALESRYPVDPGEVLCFKKNEAGATNIVRGSEHPALREWRGETNLSTLFAAGVLG